MKYTHALAILSLIICASCAGRPAIISDLEDDKVIVQAGIGTSKADIRAKAAKGCGIHNKIASANISKKCRDQYCFQADYLFACHDKKPIDARGTHDARKALGITKP